MIKKLLSTAFVALSIFATAQTKQNLIVGKNIELGTVSSEEKTQVSSKTSAILCLNYVSQIGGSLTLPRPSATVTPAACTSSLAVGYVCGSNCYGDKEKANYYGMSALSASIAAPTCSVLTLNFYKTTTGGGTGGSPTASVTISIYSGTSVSAAPGAVLGSTVMTMAQIMSFSVSSAATQFSVPVQIAPVTLPTSGGFFIGVTTPTVTGDTIALFTQAAATANQAWEKKSDNSWVAMSSRWSGFNGNLYMSALVCGTSVVGISESYGLGYGISMSPNPTSGIINMLVAPAYRENLTVSVSNALGQTLINKTYEFTNESVALDLTNYNNGIYFVTVSNGKDKMVQRIVLNK